MTDHELMDREGATPTLVSLALFAVVFFASIAAVTFGSALIDPVRSALAGMPAGIKMGALTAFILGVMALARIGVLLARAGTRGEG